jgi:hypothetical protein
VRVVRDHPKASDPAPPEADVLIEEARRRQRRRQRSIGTAALLVIGLGLGIGIGFFGPGGGDARTGSASPSGGAAGGAPGGSSTSARVLASARFPPYTYQLAVEDGKIAVIGAYGICETRLFDPRTLHLEAIDHRCGTARTTTAAAAHLVVVFGAAGDEIRVSTMNPVTHRSTVGPLLMTLQNWIWAHSGVTEGDGTLWIYGLHGFDHPSTLLDVSTSRGSVLHRFTIAAGANPFMVANADGFWITESAWGGSSCNGACTLWHVAPGSGRLVAVRSLGVRTQWLVASGNSLYVDVLTRAVGGFRQTIWRLEGPSARVAYETPGSLLPSTDFAPPTGYVVAGDAAHGYFTLTQLGKGRTPVGVGGCESAAPVRVVEIDPATGRQRYVATLRRGVAGADLDGHLWAGQSVFYEGSLYLLAGQAGVLADYQRVVQVTP